jgi:hypothetical protein
MKLKAAIFGLAFTAVGMTAIDARAAARRVELSDQTTSVQQLEDHADPIAASPGPEFSNWAMMLAGLAGLGMAGNRRKARSSLA